MPLKRRDTNHTDIQQLAAAQAGKSDAERLAVAKACADALGKDPQLDSVMADLNRASRPARNGLSGLTLDDLNKLTDILERKPDADDAEIFLAAEASVLRQLAERVSAQAALVKPSGLDGIAQIASSFDMTDGSGEIDDCVDTLCAFPEQMTAEQAKRLYIALRHSHSDVGLGESYGADFDVSAEIGEQITLVRAMRARLINSDGQLNERFSAKEAKEIMGASNALNQTLMKFQAQITNFQRLIKVENAVKAALSTLPREAQEEYLRVLEEQLQSEAK